MTVVPSGHIHITYWTYSDCRFPGRTLTLIKNAFSLFLLTLFFSCTFCIRIKDYIEGKLFMLGKGGITWLYYDFFSLSLLFISPSFYLFIFLYFVLIRALFSLDTASRTGVLGQGAVLFLRPFEARSGDPVRRELYRQQAAGHHSSSPWFAPTSVLQVTPPALPPGIQCSSGPVPSPLKKRRRRRRWFAILYCFLSWLAIASICIFISFVRRNINYSILFLYCALLYVLRYWH